MLQQLAAAFPNPLRFDELAVSTGQVPAPLAQQRNLLLRELFSLFSARALMLTPRTQHYANKISQYPHAHRLAQAQAARGHVSSVRHIDVDLDPLARHLLSLLDGTRSYDELVDSLKIAVSQTQGTHEAAVLHERIPANVDRLLALFSRHGLLSD